MQQKQTTNVKRVKSTVLSDPKHRYQLAAKRITGSKSVLDVGGYEDRRAFIASVIGQDFLYTPLNISNAWYQHVAAQYYDGNELPFADESFDAVIAVDSFEHMPRQKRGPMVAEMVRVSRHLVIIIVPFDPGSSHQFDAEFIKQSVSLNVEVKPSLAEHIKFGLPTVEELREYVKIFPYPYTIEFGTDYDRFRRMSLLQLIGNAYLGERISRQLNRLVRFCYEPTLARDGLGPANALRVIVTIRKK